MAEVICDTSPLQYLHQAGLLHLLPTLFGRVTVPEAVVGELAEGQRIGISLPDVPSLDWADVRSTSVPAALRSILELGPGESEVLALALERPGASAIVDDRLARKTARELGIPHLGALAILLMAKRGGQVTSVLPVLDRLVALGFRLNPRTRLAALRLAGEGG